MPAHIYILTDGLNTKIGITTSLDKRLSAYNTHNPNYSVYRTYECSNDQAKRIEAVIKVYYKEQITGSGKEWFSVPAEEINKLVSTLLESPSEDIITPAMHGVNLPSALHNLKEELKESLQKLDNFENSQNLREQLVDLFVNTFKIGIPRNRLPDDVVVIDGFGIDLKHCNIESHDVRKSIRDSYLTFPCDDHVRYFYHLVKLSSGSYVAICSSRISMPYLARVKKKDKEEILENARQYGLYVFHYDDWSWYAPDETALILYMNKTPIQEKLKLWNNSFRKWVIERSKLLEQEIFQDTETLQKTISDICNDKTFPLHVQSAEELYRDYIQPLWGYVHNEEEIEYRHFMQPAFDFLFEKWKGNTCYQMKPNKELIS